MSIIAPSLQTRPGPPDNHAWGGFVEGCAGLCADVPTGSQGQQEAGRRQTKKMLRCGCLPMTNPGLARCHRKLAAVAQEANKSNSNEGPRDDIGCGT
jgi:hypothetical protein